MRNTYLRSTIVAGSLLAAAPAWAVSIGCTNPACVTGDAAAPNAAAVAFSNNSSVNATSGPWDIGANTGFGYGDGNNTAATSIAIPVGPNVYTVTYTGGTATTNTTDNPPTSHDANGYPFVLQGPGSNAPAAYIPSGVVTLNQLVGTFANNGGAIVGTPFVVGRGPTLISPAAGATTLQLGINDNKYSDNAGSLSVAVKGYATTGGTATVVGNTGAGTLTLNGGVFGPGPLTVGSKLGSIGTVTLTNGAVLLDDAIIGDAGVGSFTNANSLHNVSGNLILGNQASGSGAYVITGNAAVTNVQFVAGGNGGNPNGAMLVGNAGTGAVTQGRADQLDPGNQLTVAGDLVLGQQVGSRGTYTLNTGTLNVGGQLAVGGQSTNANSFTQNGGTLNLAGSASTPTANPDYVPVGPGFAPFGGGTLSIGGGIGTGDGSNGGGAGTYTLNAGAVTLGNNLLVGATGAGTMNQNGGALSTGFSTIGFSGAGAYNLASGTLNANGMTVGFAANGVFNQTGGTNTVANGLEVGNQYSTNAAATGLYNLTGGTLNSGVTNIGNGEKGDFINASATHAVAGNVVLGGNNGGNATGTGAGTYTISGNAASLSVGFRAGGTGVNDGTNGTFFDQASQTRLPVPNMPNGALIVGQFGTGAVTQGLANRSDTGNAVTVAGDVVLGNQAGSQGAYTLNTGALTVGGKLVVGGNSQLTPTTSNNVFTQNGGSVVLTNSAGGSADYSGVGGNDGAGSLQVGGGANSLNTGNGTYQMNGGTLTVQNGGIAVGSSAVGIFNQVSGAVNVGNGTVTLGNCGGCNTGNSDGTYNLSGGTLVAGGVQAGYFGRGTVNQTGGVVTARSVELAEGPNYFNAPGGGFPKREGVYNMSAGLILASNDIIVGNAGVGTFNHTGGLVTLGQGVSGQIYPDGSVAPGIPGDNGVLGTLIIGARNGAGGYQGAGSVGVYNLGRTGQANATAWPGYPGTAGVAPPAFSDTTNAPYLQVYGNVVLGMDGAATPALGTTTGAVRAIGFDPANGTLNIAGDGATLRINNVVGGSNNGTMVVGLDGIGAVNQKDASIVYLDGALALGVNAGSTGAYTMKGGTLSVGQNLDIGGTVEVGTPTQQRTINAGAGAFSQTGGAVTVLGNLNAGNNTAAVGVYALGGGTLQVNGNGYFGNNGGAGGFTQTGGSATFGTPGAASSLILGTAASGVTGSVGTASITGSTSTLTVIGTVVIAQDPGTAGSSMTIGSGVDTPKVSITADSGQNGGFLTVGGADRGALTINSGTLTVASNTYVGGSPTGVGAVTQSGGTFQTSFLNVGASSLGNTYAMKGGTLIVDNDLVLGSTSATGATFTQTGGAVQVNSGGFGLYVNNSTYALSGGSLAVVNDLVLGDTADGGAVKQTGGSVLVGGALTVGGAHGGTYTLGGGGTLAVTKDLVVGSGPGVTGTVNFNTVAADAAAITRIGGTLVVGDKGAGVFNQGGGRLDLSGSSGGLNVGRSLGGVGVYNQTGGTLIDGAVIGDAGTGTYNNTGATHTVAGDLVLGNQSTGVGTYNLKAGGTTAVSGFTFVGASGMGTFLNDASTHSTQQLVVGQNGVQSSSYTLQNGGALVVGTPGSTGFADIGEGATGVFTQKGPGSTSTINGSLDVGRSVGGAGTLNLNGGTMTVTRFAVVGDSGAGTMNQTGGSFSAAQGLTVGRGNGNGVTTGGVGAYTLGGGTSTVGGLSIGGLAGNTGTVTQTGGVLQVNGGLAVGDSGAGTYRASAGSASVTGSVIVGNGAGSTGAATLGGTGSLSLTGAGAQLVLGQSGAQVGGPGAASGTFNFNTAAGDAATLSFKAAAGQAIIVGNGGAGTFNQGGGDLNLVAAGATIQIAALTGSTGRYAISGGTLEASSLTVGVGGAGTVVQTGGTVTVGTPAASGNLVLGSLTGSSGSYAVGGAGNPALTVNGDASIGSLGAGTFAQTTGATTDIKGSITIGNSVAGGSATVSGGNLTIGDGGAGKQLLVTGTGSMAVRNTGAARPVVTVDGTVNVNKTVGTGGRLSVTGSTLTVNNGGGTALNNAGSVSIGKDTGSPGGPASVVTLTGGVTNQATGGIAVSNSTLTVNGATTNSGMVHATSATLNWNGLFTNSGGYVSDPSINNFTNLTVTSTGYLTGAAGDSFDVSGNLLSTSTQNTLWNTVAATLAFGAGTSHILDVTGLDGGAIAAGFVDNYAWGVLNLFAGNTLSLEGTKAVDALYVSTLSGLQFNGSLITNIFGNGLNIYYDPTLDIALNDQVYALGGGGLLCPVGTPSCSLSVGPPPVPEPGSLLLLGGGLAGLAFVRRRAAPLKAGPGAG